MNKKTAKLFEVLAGHLPDRLIASTYQKTLKGEDVILAGTLEIDGKKIDPEKEYRIDNNLIREVNHKLRLKKAFKTKGKQGVIDYCKRFLKPEKHEALVEAIDMII